MHLSTLTKIKIASWASALVIPFIKLGGWDHTALVCKRGGITWCLDLREGVDLAVFLFGAFEPLETARFKQVIKPGDTVLDIGANIGAHTLTMAKLVGKEGKVVAAEPTTWAFRKLLKNCELNPDLHKRIVPVHAAMLSESTSLPDGFYSSWRLDTKTGTHPVHGGMLQRTDGAQALTLDELVQSYDLEKIDFIKIDVDGYECEVLRGASETLATYRPKILIEVCPHVLAERGSSAPEMIQELEKHGYEWARGDDPMKSIPVEQALREWSIPTDGSINVFLTAKPLTTSQKLLRAIVTTPQEESGDAEHSSLK